MADIQTNPEFYQDNYQHPESTQGSLAVHHTADADQVMSLFMDPVGTWSGGTHLFNNHTGARVNGGYELFFSGNPANNQGQPTW